MSKRQPPRIAATDGPALHQGRWRFGEFELDEPRRELRRGGVRVEIEPKPLNLLMLLLRHPGELVTRDELIEALWAGRPMSDTVLARAVVKLRQALGGDEQAWVRTVHGYGYRFVAEVSQLSGGLIETPAPASLGVGDTPPGRPHWRLRERLGNSGETWLVRHARTDEARVFKFALSPERLASLKREVTIHRLLRGNPDTAGALAPLLDWNFDEPPWFVEFAWCPLGSLRLWLEAQGGAATLPRERRLAIIIELAERLAAVHAVGVLHKDLKPDNVLVLEAPAEGTPRLAYADLGSGGVLEPQRLAELGITRLGETVSRLDGESDSGTPLYLPPEILAGRAWTRQSDIYALGVMLFQLLVGDLRRPLAPGWEREVDDPLLCEDIAAAADLQPEHRLLDALDLARRLRGLEGRRRARAAAEEAEQAAARLHRQLERARLSRRWQRALSGVLLVATVLAFSLYLRTRAAQHQAERAAAETLEVSRFLDEQLLGSADPYRAGGGRDVTVVSLLDTAASGLDRLKNQPPLFARLALTLGRAYHNLGLEKQAQALLQRALEVGEATAAPNEPRTVALRDELAWVEVEMSRYSEASALFTRNLGGARDSDFKARYGLARVRFEEGYFRDAGERFAALLAEAEQHQGGTDFTADLRWDIAEAQFELHDWAAAEQQLDQAEAHYRRTLGADNPLLLWLEVSQAYRLQMLQRWDEAETLLQKILAKSRSQLGEHHPITVASLQMLGVLRVKQGRPAEALPLFQQVLTWRQSYYGIGHYLTRVAMNRLGEAYTLLGRGQEAEPLLRQASQASVLALGEEHPHTLDIARTLAECLAAVGKVEESEALFRQTLLLGSKRLDANNNRLAWTRYGLARLLLVQGRFEEAKPLLIQAEQDFLHNFGPDNSVRAQIEALRRQLGTAATIKPSLDRLS